MLGQFGGHATGQLRTGDVLRLAAPQADAPPATSIAQEERPELTQTWELGVLYGPHGAPDFFRDEDIAELFSSEYEVHFNSARTGVRLIGPKPRWARTDGGEAGLHPSIFMTTPTLLAQSTLQGTCPSCSARMAPVWGLCLPCRACA